MSDPAEFLKARFTTVQVQQSGKPRFVLSERNRLKLERMHERVRKLRGGK